jgi:hypothetical protein
MRLTRILLVMLGLLDAVLLGRFAHSINFLYYGLASAPWWFEGLEFARPFFLLSLSISAIGLSLERQWGLILSYLQFPFRVVYLYLSFGFLTLITVPLFGASVYKPTLVAALVLEGVRLIATIFVHVRLVRATRT